MKPLERRWDFGGLRLTALMEFLVHMSTHGYVYIPLGGSQRGLLGTLLSTAMTFAFVSYWHGSHEDLWSWAALNWLGVTVESGARRLLEKPRVRETLARFLSPPARRRLHALLASCATSMLILFNLVFLGGIQVGKTYWDRIFLQGGHYTGEGFKPSTKQGLASVREGWYPAGAVGSGQGLACISRLRHTVAQLGVSPSEAAEGPAGFED
nr:protein-cysteine N-palmitoyltransferase HHAT-like [Meriones unguiculatus]